MTSKEDQARRAWSLFFFLIQIIVILKECGLAMGILTVTIGITFKDFNFIISPLDWAIGNGRIIKGVGNVRLDF